MPPSRCASARTACDEHLAAMHVVAEHVVARARRREQHGVARTAARDMRARTASSMLAARRSGTPLPASTLLRSLARRGRSARPRARARRPPRERREILALAVAARDQHDRAPSCRSAPPRWRRRWCLSNRRRRRRRRSPPLSRRRCGKPAKRAAGRRASPSSGQPDRIAERERGERIGRVVQIRRRAARRPAAACRVPRASIDLAARCPSRCVAGGASEPERDDAAAGDAPCHAARVVAVEHLHAAAFEDARLGRGVVVDAVVAVEMIFGHVEHGRRIGVEARRALELEARKLEHEDVRHSGRRASIASSASSTGRPMLPATTVSRPCRAHMSPAIAVTVLLPLEPVMASTLRPRHRASPRERRSCACANSSMSPTTGTPRRIASATGGSRGSMPGLIAIASTPLEQARASNAPVCERHVAATRPRACAACGGLRACRPRDTRAPWRSSQRVIDNPVSPSPSTSTFLSFQSIQHSRSTAASESTIRPAPASS